jgi:hypothetical protein
VLIDIIAIILGILYTMRKLDVAKRTPEQFPHVATSDFDRWKRLEGGAYTLGSFACFAKIVVDYAFQWHASRTGLDWSWVRVVGGLIFVGWVVALMLSAVRGAQGRRLRETLGIDLVRRASGGR